MSLASMCKNTITIQQSTLATDGGAGEMRTWATRGTLTGITASIQAQGGGEAASFAARGVNISHAIYTDTDVSASVVGDRVTDEKGRTFIVKFVEDMGAQGRAWAIYVLQET